MPGKGFEGGLIKNGGFDRFPVTRRFPNETPGDDLRVRGINDFVRSQQGSQSSFNGLFDTANQVGLSDAVDKARENASSSFDVAEGSNERRTRGLGLNLTRRQKKSRDKRFKLSRAVADADAISSTKRNFAERALQASRAAGGLENSLRDIDAAGRTSLANAAGQEKINQENKRAERKGSQAGVLGSVIGIAASIFSSEDYKHDKRPVVKTEGSLLKRLKNVRVDKWKYVGDETDHIGPYAEEFNETFNVGEDNKQMINLGDAVGVLMGSIKELDAKVEARG